MRLDLWTVHLDIINLHFLCRQMAKQNDLVVLFRSLNGDLDQDPYVQAVKSCGFRVACVPVLDFQFINLDTLYKALCQPHLYSGLVLTSPRAVQAIEAATQRSDWRDTHGFSWSQLPSFVVGQATAAAAKNLDMKSVGQDSGNAEKLVPQILRDIPTCSQPLLFPCGNLSKEILPKALADNAVELTTLTVYETGAHQGLTQCLRKVIENEGPPLFVVYYSPSGVNFTWPVLYQIGLNPENIGLIAIGPTTEQALLDKGMKVAAVASKPTPLSLKEALLAAESPSRSY